MKKVNIPSPYFKVSFFFFDLLLFTFLKFQPLGWIQIHVDQMCGYRDSIVKSAVSEKLEGDE